MDGFFYRALQRRSLRRAVRADCQVVTDRHFQLVGVRALDLSIDGMLLESDHRPPIGEEVIVSLKLPGTTMWVDAEAEVEGWLAEADLSLSDWPAAIAEVAAITAATRASFLNCMVWILSFGQLTAIRFGSRGAFKFRGASAPSGAGLLRARAGGTAT